MTFALPFQIAALLAAPVASSPVEAPVAALTIRTFNAATAVPLGRIPENPLAAPFWIAPLDDKRISYRLDFSLWTPQAAPAIATGGLRRVSDAGDLEWPLMVSAAPTRAEVIATTPNALPALLFDGCGAAVGAGQPRHAFIAPQMLDEWRETGTPHHAWRPGALGIGQGVWNAEQLRAEKRIARAAAEYRLQTSYTPDLTFNVGTEQEFMAPLQLELGPLPLKWERPLRLRWNPLEGALGYRLRITARRLKSNDPDSVAVIWSSAPLGKVQSEEWLGDPAAALRAGKLLAPETVECTIPAGIFKDAGQITFWLQAVGRTRAFQSENGRPALRLTTVSEVLVSLDSGQLNE
jgi:hypothetical protein